MSLQFNRQLVPAMARYLLGKKPQPESISEVSFVIMCFSLGLNAVGKHSLNQTDAFINLFC